MKQSSSLQLNTSLSIKRSLKDSETHIIKRRELNQIQQIYIKIIESHEISSMKKNSLIIKIIEGEETKQKLLALINDDQNNSSVFQTMSKSTIFKIVKLSKKLLEDCIYCSVLSVDFTHFETDYSNQNHLLSESDLKIMMTNIRRQRNFESNRIHFSCMLSLRRFHSDNFAWGEKCQYDLFLVKIAHAVFQKNKFAFLNLMFVSEFLIVEFLQQSCSNETAHQLDCCLNMLTHVFFLVLSQLVN